MIRKILASGLIVLAAGSVLALGSNAVFTDTLEVDANTFTTGEVESVLRHPRR